MEKEGLNPRRPVASVFFFVATSVVAHLGLLSSTSTSQKTLQSLRSRSTAAAAAAAAPAASVAASVAAVAESARAAVLSTLAAILPESLTQQLANLSPAVSLLLSALAAVAAFLLVKKVFDTPSRKYDPANPNVGDEYDAWTR